MQMPTATHNPPRTQVSGEKEFFSEMVVNAVSRLDPATLDLKMIGMKKVGVLVWLTEFLRLSC